MQVFSIAPPSMGLKLFWPVGVILLIVMVILGAALIGAWRTRFEVSPAGLRLRGDLYGRLIPANQLQLDAVRQIDLAAEPEFAPRWRTVGTGLPGYQAGWFRLRNGEKALLYLTDRSRAVYIPTTAGYSVLMSPSEPDAFLSALRAAAGSVNLRPH